MASTAKVPKTADEQIAAWIGGEAGGAWLEAEAAAEACLEDEPDDRAEVSYEGPDFDPTELAGFVLFADLMAGGQPGETAAEADARVLASPEAKAEAISVTSLWTTWPPTGGLPPIVPSSSWCRRGVSVRLAPAVVNRGRHVVAAAAPGPHAPAGRRLQVQTTI